MGDDANYAFGETFVSAEVSSAQRATPDELVALAKSIWRSVGASGVPPADEDGNEALLARLQAEHEDFNRSFPLVLRWMVQMRQFKAKALRKYLVAHASAKLDTREGFLRLQAEYLVLLYREAHSHADEAFVRRYREALVKQLLDEDKAFLDMHAQVEADIADRAKEADADRRQRLVEYLLARKVADEKRAASGP